MHVCKLVSSPVYLCSIAVTALSFYELIHVVLAKPNHSRLTKITVWHLYCEDEDNNVCGSFRRTTGPFHDTNPVADLEARSGQSPLSTVPNMDAFREENVF